MINEKLAHVWNSGGRFTGSGVLLADERPGWFQLKDEFSFQVSPSISVDLVQGMVGDQIVAGFECGPMLRDVKLIFATIDHYDDAESPKPAA